jgi:hypothetical protein
MCIHLLALRHMTCGNLGRISACALCFANQAGTAKTCRSASTERTCRRHGHMQCIIKKTDQCENMQQLVIITQKLNRTTWLHWRPGTPQVCFGSLRTRPPHHVGLQHPPLAAFVGSYIAPPLLGPVGHQALLLSVMRHGTT